MATHCESAVLIDFVVKDSPGQCPHPLPLCRDGALLRERLTAFSPDMNGRMLCADALEILFVLPTKHRVATQDT